MAWIPAAIAVGGSLLDSASSKSAAKRDRRRREKWASQAYSPFIEFGKGGMGTASGALSNMQSLLQDPSKAMGPGGVFNKEFEFLRGEGLRGVRQQFGAAGKGLSSQAMRGASKFGSGFASTFLDQMLNRQQGVFSSAMQQIGTGLQATGAQGAVMFGGPPTQGNQFGGALAAGYGAFTQAQSNKKFESLVSGILGGNTTSPGGRGSRY